MIAFDLKNSRAVIRSRLGDFKTVMDSGFPAVESRFQVVPNSLSVRKLDSGSNR